MRESNLVTLFDDIRTEQRGLRADMAELKQTLRAVESRLGKLSETLATLTVSSGELSKAIAGVDKRIDEKHAELIKWSFLFWVGAVGAIAALAGAFRG